MGGLRPQAYSRDDAAATGGTTLGYDKGLRERSLRNRLAAVREFHGLEQEGVLYREELTRLLELKALHTWRFLALFQYVQEYIPEEDQEAEEDDAAKATHDAPSRMRSHQLTLTLPRGQRRRLPLHARV